MRTAFKPAELAPILRRLKPTLYIGEISLYDNVAPIDAFNPRAEQRIVVDGGEDHGGQPPEALFDAASNEGLLVPVAPYKPAVLITTSGTTGERKFVVHTGSRMGPRRGNEVFVSKMRGAWRIAAIIAQQVITDRLIPIVNG